MKKKIFAFDLDGTLAISKGPIDEQMRLTLQELLREHEVCIISGGKWQQFQEQLLSNLNKYYSQVTNRLHLFPTCGTTYYKYQHPEWVPIYNMFLSEKEKFKIRLAFKTAFIEIDYNRRPGFAPPHTWGEVIEDRSTQITFSACGQEAPNDAKVKWDPDRSKRKEIISVLETLIPEFEIRLGGNTSIDVTMKGCDKGLAIQKIKEYLKCNTDDIVFFGDALEPGGNDHAVYQTGVECIPVDNHIDCVWKIRAYKRSL